MSNQLNARNYIMKKYIVPAIQVVNLSTEDTILAGSGFGTNNVVGGPTQFSNERQRASDAIWGFDDED